MDDFSTESFGSIPNASEEFGTLPQTSADFRTIPNNSERSEQHTLTVREVARRFEDAGVPRTERSIINWCQKNRQGVARLDAFFDTNERKYFITSQSVSLAIQEESAKKPQVNGNAEMPSRERPAAEEAMRASEEESHQGEDVRDLRRKIIDLEITNRVKEQFVEILQQERERFTGERDSYVRELMTQSRRIGELETQVLQLGNGRTGGAEIAPIDS